MKLIALFIALSSCLRAEQTEKGAVKTWTSEFALGFVCVVQEKMPEEGEVEKAFREAYSLAPDVPLEVEVTEREQEKDGEQSGHSITVTFAEGDFVIVTSVGMPVPWKDMQYACMNSFYWPEAEEVMQRSKSHYLVVANSPREDKKERALHLSKALSAVAKASDALGIYYGAADIVHEPKAYSDLFESPIESAEDVPVIAWVGFLFSRDRKGRTSLYTRGLVDFGCKEVEVVKSDQAPADIFDLVSGISQYLIFAGDVIKDGDTVGGSGEEKIKVRLKKSQLDREKVLRVDF